MSAKQGTRRIPSEVWAVLLIAVIVVAVLVSLGSFTRAFTPIVPVTLISDRSGLVLEPNARVKLRGVQVGRVSTIKRGADRVDIKLAIDPSQISYIPANVEARIQSTSLFGSKFIDLVYPSDPSPQRLSAGAVLKSRNVGVEVNTVFQNVVELIKQIDPFKLNAVLAALAEGVRGQGERIGEAITASNEVLLALNSRSDTIRGDVRALKSVSDAYSTAAHNILDTLDAATTTSVTVTTHSKQLDALLLNVASVSRSGIGLLGPSKDNLVKSAKLLEPTANLLMKYNPELTCLFVGAKVTLDTGYADMLGGNGRSLLMDAQLLPGYDAYRYPDNLPIDAAKADQVASPDVARCPTSVRTSRCGC